MSFFVCIGSVALALAVCAALIPACRLCALRVGAVDTPGRRKGHARPTPCLGGLGVYAALCLALLFFFPLSSRTVAVVAGGGLITALGMTDDIFDLPAGIKLAVEGVAGLIPAAWGLFPTSLGSGGETMLVLSPFFQLLFGLGWVLLLTNAINLIDGLDCLAATQVGVSSLGLCLLGVPQAGGVLGACLGFLPYNRHPASCFLGDCGALLLGYALGVFSLGEKGQFEFLTLFLFAVPLFDLFDSFFRRIMHGKHPFQADDGHLHHRLCRAGHSCGRTVGLLLMLSTVTALCALGCLWVGVAFGIAMPLCLLLFALLLCHL